MNLVNLLLEQAARQPKNKALIDGRNGRERVVNFGQLEHRINACAKRLNAAGIGRGARVLVLVPMRSELYLTLAAIWKVGATALFLDPSAGRRHIAACCLRTSPDAVIGIPAARLLWWLQGALRRIPVKLVWGSHLKFGEEDHSPMPTAEVDNDTPAILTFTSGSTGVPKGAIRTHGLLHAQYRALRKAIALEAGEVELATMPIIALVNLAAGITTLIPDADLKRPGFVNTTPIREQIAHFQTNRCVASPAFLQRFPPASGRLKKIYTGGAPVFPRGVEEIQKAFPGAVITVLYGSTEAEPISHIAWPDVADRDRTAMANGSGLLVGAVAPEAEVQVVADQWGTPIGAQNSHGWRQSALGVGGIGEIVVSGAHVIPGYLNGLGDEENKVSVEGRIWHRTGDAGYFDAMGRLWLMGRCAAKFIFNGKYIYPFAIECAAVEQLSLPIAACCSIRGEPTLFLPKEATIPIPHEFSVGTITIRRIIRTKIPLDKRHNAKVDYARLKAQ